MFIKHNKTQIRFGLYTNPLEQVMDSNHQPRGYEPRALPIAPTCYISPPYNIYIFFKPQSKRHKQYPLSKLKT